MKDGLKGRTRKAISEVLKKYPMIEHVVLFGSRAMGTYTSASDIDLALYGELTLRDQIRIAADMEQLSIPYTVDLVRMNVTTSPDLLEHIRQHGKPWQLTTEGPV